MAGANGVVSKSGASTPKAREAVAAGPSAGSSRSQDRNAALVARLLHTREKYGLDDSRGRGKRAHARLQRVRAKISPADRAAGEQLHREQSYARAATAYNVGTRGRLISHPPYSPADFGAKGTIKPTPVIRPRGSLRALVKELNPDMFKRRKPASATT